MNNQLPLLTLMKQQQEHLDVLLLLLNAELTALAQRDVEALEDNSQQKLACLDVIQHLDAAIATHGELDALKQQVWFVDMVAQIDHTLSACKEQNEINRQTLEQSQLKIDTLKHQLLQSHGKSGLTYTAKGKPALDAKGKGIKA